MAQGLPRTRFNSSNLVRALADLAVADVAASKQSFADRLGQWLGFADALTLFSVINADKAAPDVLAAAPSAESSAARQALARVRAALVESITTDGVIRPGRARIELPTPDPQASIESAADFAPYHRYYLAHQRDMSASIGPLRITVRAALSGQTPALARLAALDAVMEQALAGRERDLLATVPGLLGRRFDHLYKLHQLKLAEAQAADDSGRWMQPGGWLAGFCREMQSVLLAELDLRLQPVAGMIAALENVATGKQ
ncbi:DUF3348 domain-containing protein [Azoarcus sp. DN11]|uniref:DUF3348 domain-containing protein n=1 Tax=Azoarcus sp. DN11 TaxID=356837 RepID=UPI000EB493CB|nr:DUF3348 domain-containing protein [Azoarcus sp. DN11]AYH44298.1 hypothetical protein CDA09_13025 [Azoarcus sp. DN11]